MLLKVHLNIVIGMYKKYRILSIWFQIGEYNFLKYFPESVLCWEKKKKLLDDKVLKPIRNSIWL